MLRAACAEASNADCVPHSQLDPSVRVGHESATELHAFWDYGCGASGLERIHSEGAG